MEKHPAAYAIEALMEYRGTNPKRLAKNAGVGETYIRDIIKGRSLDPQTSKLVKVASALSCTLDDLVTLGRRIHAGDTAPIIELTAEPAGAQATGQGLYTEEEISLIGLWRELSPAQRGALVSFLEATVDAA